MGVDPKHADQIVRGTVSLPHGTGKKLKVLVIAKGDKADEAISAGADFAGDKELLDTIGDIEIKYDFGVWKSYNRILKFCKQIMTGLILCNF